jgi:Asp-tRNA(Asn)/Glu-tRNA(Gln) amidotransferase A subunit family amidase
MDPNLDFLKRISVKGQILAANNNQNQFIKVANGYRDQVAQLLGRAGVTTALEYGAPPAVKLNKIYKLEWIFTNLYQYNYLNWPAGVVPITQVTESEQFYNGSFRPAVDEVLRESMQGSAGMPLGVQVVGMPWHEEAVIETMRLLDRN